MNILSYINCRGGVGGVQDRTIYEDSVFARMLRDSGHMDERDYNTYIELFKNSAWEGRGFHQFGCLSVKLTPEPPPSLVSRSVKFYVSRRGDGCFCSGSNLAGQT